MKDILLVEDQKELADLIRIFLEKEGYSVCHTCSGEEALAYLSAHKAKLMLLDLMLPGIDGFAVCRRVREKWNLPIVILSARAGRSDKLNGYELGADDYVEKPVDIEILTAKVKVMLQRASSPTGSQDIIKSGALTLHQGARKVYKNGNLIEMNVKEYDLLSLFVKNPGKTLHKDYIFGKIWGIDSNSENQTLTVHIKMLRSKIEEDSRKPKRVQTVWGVGYRYEEI